MNIQSFAAPITEAGYTLSVVIKPTEADPVAVKILEPLRADGSTWHAVNVWGTDLEETMERAMNEFRALNKRPVRVSWPVQIHAPKPETRQVNQCALELS